MLGCRAKHLDFFKISYPAYKLISVSLNINKLLKLPSVRHAYNWGGKTFTTTPALLGGFPYEKPSGQPKAITRGGNHKEVIFFHTRCFRWGENVSFEIIEISNGKADIKRKKTYIYFFQIHILTQWLEKGLRVFCRSELDRSERNVQLNDRKEKR